MIYSTPLIFVCIQTTSSFFYNYNMDPENQMRSGASNPIKINIERLQLQFQCTVCLNPINDAYITRCGHVYCKACIQQTTNRHHRCPFCNQDIKQFKADVFKNYHFNTIRKIVEEEKQLEEKKYLQKVFASDDKNQIENENKEIQQLLKPIQMKIKQLFQQTVLQYRKYIVSLYNLEKEAERKKILNGSLMVRDNFWIMKQIQCYITQKIKSPILSPEIIEKATHIEILMPGNKINKNVIKIAPMATFQSLLPYIDKICSENNILLKGKIQDSLTVNGSSVSIKDRVGLLSGGIIKIQKGIPFEEKVYCFTFGWEKQKQSNFYSCKTCNIKWICENCALHCHAGHTYQMQVKDHKSDWAMCYCVTKCNCKALNKNNMALQ